MGKILNERLKKIHERLSNDRKEWHKLPAKAESIEAFREKMQ